MRRTRPAAAALAAGLLLALAPGALGDPGGAPHDGSNGKGRDGEKATTTEATPPAPAPAPGPAPAPAAEPAAAPQPAPAASGGRAERSPAATGGRAQRATSTRTGEPACAPRRARAVEGGARPRRRGAREQRARGPAPPPGASAAPRAAAPRPRSAPSRARRPATPQPAATAAAPGGVLGATVRCCDDEPALNRLLAQTASAGAGDGGTPAWLLAALAAAGLLAAVSLQRAYVTRSRNASRQAL